MQEDKDCAFHVKMCFNVFAVSVVNLTEMAGLSDLQLDLSPCDSIMESSSMLWGYEKKIFWLNFFFLLHFPFLTILSILFTIFLVCINYVP